MRERQAWFKGSRMARMAGATVLAAGILCMPVYADTKEPQAGTEAEMHVAQEGTEAGIHAAGWEDTDGKWYYYNEAGVKQTGWVRAAEDGLWYYLDTETGAWIPRPVLDETASEKLLENAIVKFGYYKYEEEPVYFQVDYKDKHRFYMSVRVITGPDTNRIINTYKVEKKNGEVKPAVGETFNLYQ